MNDTLDEFKDWLQQQDAKLRAEQNERKVKPAIFHLGEIEIERNQLGAALNLIDDFKKFKTN